MVRTKRSEFGTSRSVSASRLSAVNTIGSGSCVHILKSTYWLLATTGGQQHLASAPVCLLGKFAVGSPRGRKVHVHEGSLRLMHEGMVVHMHEGRTGRVHDVALMHTVVQAGRCTGSWSGCCVCMRHFCLSESPMHHSSSVVVVVILRLHATSSSTM